MDQSTSQILGSQWTGKIRPWRPFQAETEEFSKTLTGPHQEG